MNLIRAFAARLSVVGDEVSRLQLHFREIWNSDPASRAWFCVQMFSCTQDSHRIRKLDNRPLEMSTVDGDIKLEYRDDFGRVDCSARCRHIRRLASVQLGVYIDVLVQCSRKSCTFSKS